MLFFNLCISLLLFTQSLFSMNSSTLTTFPKNPSATSQNLTTHNAQQQIITTQLVNSPTTPKRLKKELEELLENKNFTTTACSTNDKTHPYIVNATFYDNNTEHMTVICKIPSNYPFKAPLISLKTNDAQLSKKDLTSIADNTNKQLDQKWNPQRKIQDVVTTYTSEQIKAYKNKILASQMIAQGHVRTMEQIKEKYLSKNIPTDIQYPELQKKFNGVWAKQTADGYFIFHIEGNYINMSFEPHCSNDAPSQYYGYYSALTNIKNNNHFNINICDDSDSNIVNNFELILNNGFISIIFPLSKNGSTLDTIISKFEPKTNYDWIGGTTINLTKI